MQIKKKILIMFLGLIIMVGKTNLSYGQWIDEGTSMITGDRVGVGGLSNPGASLEVYGNTGIRMTDNFGNYDSGIRSTHVGWVGQRTDYGYYHGNETFIPVITQLLGNVGIGTTNPTQRLSVAGTIRAYDVIVETGWADYVFAPEYKLMTLAKLEERIKEDKHLPGIPSAAEVKEKGVSLGEMQTKLLEKVEELTLYMIALQKDNDQLKTRVNTLENGK